MSNKKAVKLFNHLSNMTKSKSDFTFTLQLMCSFTQNIKQCVVEILKS